MSSVVMTADAGVRREAVGAASPLRLTRRGRLTVFLSSLAVVCAGLVVLAGTAIGSGASGTPVPTREVTVQPGDTLWGIASRVAPGEDPRETIEEIRDLNAVGAGLQSGEKLDVPVSR